MRLNHNKVLLAERFHCYIRVYYADGHYELRDENIQDYIKQNRGKSGSKHPILIENQNLYPTIDQKENLCCWINLGYIEEKNPFYIWVLQSRGLYDKAVKMYVNFKLKELVKDSC